MLEAEILSSALPEGSDSTVSDLAIVDIEYEESFQGVRV